MDMKRYNHLLAGASWMGEYGNPDVPEEWAYIQTFSPYHNVKKSVKYPRTLITTSTRDDRVHPGHARKMVARMREQGHDVVDYENIEGGHSAAALDVFIVDDVVALFAHPGDHLPPHHRWNTVVAGSRS